MLVLALVLTVVYAILRLVKSNKDLSTKQIKAVYLADILVAISLVANLVMLWQVM